MKVLVDTCVWSKALRYKSSALELAEKIKELIKKQRGSHDPADPAGTHPGDIKYLSMKGCKSEKCTAPFS
jgi:hypothetical protein